MDRRQFLNRTAALLAVGAVAGKENLLAAQPAAQQSNSGRIGLQLYSVRNDLPKDFIGTLKKISNLGYAEVETYGVNDGKFFDNTMKDLQKLLNDMGMSISGTHASSGVLPENTNAPEWDYWKKMAEAVVSGGGKWATQSSFPHGRQDPDTSQLKRITEHFNRLGEVCKKGGVKFGYHNHTREFNKFDNEVILDYLIKNTDPELVFFQIDWGHAVRAGADCLHYLRTYPNRIPMWHVSDFNSQTEQYTDIGKGSVPYKTMFSLPNTGGLQQLTVEQETEDDIFGSLKANVDYLKQFEWTKG